MRFPFDPHQGLITVQAELTGPSATAVLRLALDSGVTSTLINVGMLVSTGYDPALCPERVQVTTGSGVEFAPQISVIKLRALGERSAQISRFLATHYHPVRGLMAYLVWIFFVDRN